MRNHFLLLLSFCCYAAAAQNPKTDSLRHLLEKEKTDSNRVTLLWQLAEQYEFFKPDTALQLAQEALLLARRINYTEGESRSLAIMATGQYLMGNYPSALNNYMGKLQIEEKRNSQRNYASALNNIGLMYILLVDYPNALQYLYRADSAVRAAGGATQQELGNRIVINLGETWYRMKRADSADFYFSKALTTAVLEKDDFYQGAALLGLGNVQTVKGQDSTALYNYRRALDFLGDGTNNDMLCETAQGLANVFLKTRQPDSALHYAMFAFNTAKHDGFLSRQLDAANFLSHFYKGKKAYDSAFLYMERSVSLQDSISGQAKTREAMIISTNEQLRQAELAEQKQRDNEARLQQLQILIICIFIPIFFLLTVAVSRISITRNAVRFMGVVSLLLVFEFLALLLHPFISERTHHNKVLELLFLVVIGAGLVPLHHMLEHLLIQKLTRHRVKPQPIVEKEILVIAEEPVAGSAGENDSPSASTESILAESIQKEIPSPGNPEEATEK